MRWISALVAVCGGIDASAVWTVPGNHDVSWAVLGTCEIAKDFRSHLRRCTPEAVDETLRTRMSSDPGAAGLFIPLGAYNDFARKFLCESTPTQPHWFDDRTLDVDGWPVRLTGLNSALTSDRADHEHQAGTAPTNLGPGSPTPGPGLVLGTEQCRLPRAGDPIHIVMAHHPPSWIRDWKIVRALHASRTPMAIRTRARVSRRAGCRLRNRATCGRRSRSRTRRSRRTRAVRARLQRLDPTAHRYRNPIHRRFTPVLVDGERLDSTTTQRDPAPSRCLAILLFRTSPQCQIRRRRSQTE